MADTTHNVFLDRSLEELIAVHRVYMEDYDTAIKSGEILQAGKILLKVDRLREAIAAKDGSQPVHPNFALDAGTYESFEARQARELAEFAASIR